ncbi:MAG: 4-hydroxy-3-methylbut-2-enyl diphosphate reductase [Candidatus Omnitrophota bacterium]
MRIPIKINLAKSAGFCFGVKRAINIAVHTANRKKNVYMLGDIVHNEDVVNKIHRLGIKKIKKLAGGRGKLLILRAHGASHDAVKRAERFGYEIIDATCPMVKEIHKIAVDMEKNGRKIIIIGDKKHDEVKGIIGQLKEKTIVIDDIGNIPLTDIKKIKKGCVVVQSTQDIDKVLKIVGVLRKHIRDLAFFNTVCRPTRLKQEEIKTMSRKNDAMVIIGSKSSANTRRLYEISKSVNKRSHWVNNKKDIGPEWFKGLKKIGVTAGASTPKSTINGIIRYLSCLFQ